MPLSPPKARQHLHTRDIDLRGYHRDDGLFDIEVHFSDKKTYSYESPWRGTVASGYPIHDMSIRVSVDAELVVREVDVAMNVQPYTICSDILPNFQKLVGVRIGPGWNKRVREAVGGVAGCTHLAELMGPIATVAFQTMSGDYPRQLMGKGEQDKTHGEGDDSAPFMINGCYTWRAGSPVVERDYPEYFEAEAQAVKLVESE